MSNPLDYTVGWICAISTEYVAAQAFLDEKHDSPVYVSTNDNNVYVLGRIGKHNVVIAVAPDGEYGTQSAAAVARDMMHSFPNIRIGIMVGIAGGAPSQKHDIRLGDIVVSAPRNGKGGVIQYDFGKDSQDQGFLLTGFLNQPPSLLRAAVAGLRAQYESDGHQLEEAINAVLDKKPRLQKNYSRPDPSSDQLYLSTVVHPFDDENGCAEVCGHDPALVAFRAPRTETDDNPSIHYGLIASANRVMKNALVRDDVAASSEVLCFEMEAAGLMNHFPCLVVRGICDYSDSHKNKQWQGYAAMAAAAYAKEILYQIVPNKIEAEKPLSEAISNLEQVSSMIRGDQVSADVKKWLDAPDAFLNHNRAHIQRHGDTGLWFLDGPDFAKWIQGNLPFLWLRGPAGCGKSVLFSSAIQRVSLKKSLVHKIGVAFYYFSFRESLKQDVSGMLRALILQLSTQLADGVQYLNTLRYSTEMNRLSDSDLFGVLQGLVQKFSRVFILIDALDKVPEGFVRDLVLNTLIDMHHWHYPQPHLLVTSRDLEDIRLCLKTESTEEVVMRNTGIDGDIASCIKARLVSDTKLQRWQDYHEIIEKVLTARANGVFRWVDCQLQSIARLPMSESSLKRCLAHLPKTLDETYERLLSTIEPDFVDDARQLLIILCFSAHVLTVHEAIHALAVNLKSTARFERARILKEAADLRILCPGLIAVENCVPYYPDANLLTSQTVQIGHFSIQQYLRSPRIRSSKMNCFALEKGQAHMTMARICLAYFLKPKLSRPYKSIGDSYAFLEYARDYWFYHYKNASSQKAKLDEELLQLMTLPQNNFEKFMNWFNVPPNLQTDVRSLKAANKCLDPMLHNITNILAATETNRDKRPLDLSNVKSTSGYECLFRLACASGHEQVVRQLLNRHFYVTKHHFWTSEKTLLHYAMLSDNLDDTKLLLRNGADPNVRIIITHDSDWHLCGIYTRSISTPLFDAVGKRRVELIRILLDFGADVDIPYVTEESSMGVKTTKHVSALEEATRLGYRDVVELLSQAKERRSGKIAI